MTDPADLRERIEFAGTELANLPALWHEVKKSTHLSDVEFHQAIDAELREGPRTAVCGCPGVEHCASVAE